MAAIAGKLLRDMGFTNVHILKGGTVAWKDAGYATYSPQAVGAGNNLCNKNQEELK
jgi:3-mercaptopyruvate sulfurtransferase SseA